MLKIIRKLFYIVCAIGLIAFSVNMFLGPHNIAAGGVTGLGIIFEDWLGVDRSAVITIGNAAVLLIAFLFLGKEIFFNTAIGASLLPLLIRIIPKHMLVMDAWLSMAAGSVLFGIGVTILYSNNASSGGTAIPPLILKKYLGLSPSIGLFITDGVVVLLCLLVYNVDTFLYAVFSIFITSATMSYFENGVNKKKMVYIISRLHEKISSEILHSLNRGCTIIPVTGAYSGNDAKMLLVTMDKRDYRQLLTIVDKYDKEAFMITDTVSDVHGEGFTYNSGSV